MPIQKLSFTLVIFLHFYYDIKTVTFMVFDIPIPNFINSTIDIYDFPEKIMGNGINEKMLYLCSFEAVPKKSV